MIKVCIVASSVMLVTMMTCGVQGAPSHKQPATHEQNHRILFIDDVNIAHTKNLTRVMHQPHKRGAVLTPDVAAGETMIQARSAPMWIPDKKLYRMEYIAVWQGNWRPMIAESKDGIHWSRPDFHRPGVTPVNRVIVNSPDAKWQDINNVVFDPDDPNPARRFKGLAGDIGRIPCVSEDCQTFNLLNVPPLTSGDESQLVYDRRTHCYIASLKTFTKYGRSVGISTSSDFIHWSAVTTVFSTDDEDQVRARGIIKSRIANKSLMPLAFVDPEPPANYVPNLTGNATWGCDTYNMAIFPYEGGYIGLPAIFYRTGLDERGTNTDGFHEIQLAWSRDLHHWLRVGDRGVFIGPSSIAHGRLGIFDRCQLLPTSRPILHGDELWFYYTGLKWRDNPYAYHADRTRRDKSEWTPQEIADEKEGTGAVCLAVLRRDGFVSLDAGNTPGEVVTKPMPVTGKCLHLNLDAVHGEARVALIQDGKVVPGFALNDCEPIVGDTPRAIVRWKTGDLTKLKGQSVSLRIEMNNASLYSVWMDD